MARNRPYAADRAGLPALALVDGFGSVTQVRESYFVSQDTVGYRDDFGVYRARRARYDVTWAFSENNVYRPVHRWSEHRNREYDLYAYTRSICAQASLIAAFWGSHLLGGQIDPDAGDGSCRPSALPIVVPARGDAADAASDGRRQPAGDRPGDGVSDAEAERVATLRAAVARVFRESFWQTNKDILALHGAVMGDCFIGVADDPVSGRVYLKVVHPKTVVHVDQDDAGNVDGYIIQEWRHDPEWDGLAPEPPLVLYREEADKEGESVVFTTYRNGELYDWRSYPDGTPDGARVGPQWSEPYGFVPLVKIQHRNVGLGWGLSEYHADIPLFQEADDLGSKISDFIRITVDAPMMISGVANDGAGTVATADGDVGELAVEFGDDDGRGQQSGRSGQVLLKTPNPNARATPLYIPLDLPGALAHLTAIKSQVERNHPELQADLATASGDASGRALRVARERVERLVIDRRLPYDDGHRRAIQMVISIGAMKKYKGYEAFDAESYRRGDLDFTIGDRPVFAVDQADRIELEQANANVLKTYKDAGVPMTVAMKRLGFSAEEIQAATDEIARAEASALDHARRMQALAFDGDGGDGGGGPGGAESGDTVGDPTGDGLAVGVGGDGRYGNGPA